MKLSVLIDNNTFIDRYFLGEPATSYFIEDGDSRILFDVGYSDAFLVNARKLQINLLDLDYLLFSHGHLDHMWGLDSLLKMFTEADTEKIPHTLPVIIDHPKTFHFRPRSWLGGSGSLVTKERLSKYFTFQTTTKPVWLTKNLVWLGEIPRTNDFENKKPFKKIRIDGKDEDDFVVDESALVYKSHDGLVVISPCSHAGICNIIDYAKVVCGESRIADVVGGFHLLNPDTGVLTKTVEYFQVMKPKIMHPCHCTDFASKSAISRIAPIEEVGSGLQLEYAQ
jgi:7,8-dihydropterin-6-yl-methyl-4-(beta-D-ribofuranosyl)aminobenzene 5'-phosphate synthase